jgi:hypothetical protein
MKNEKLKMYLSIGIDFMQKKKMIPVDLSSTF